jgi:hypothetical protein
MIGAGSRKEGELAHRYPERNYSLLPPLGPRKLCTSRLRTERSSQSSARVRPNELITEVTFVLSYIPLYPYRYFR